MALAPDTLLNNRYRIVSILGQGGMGAIYRAEDENLGISVAVKENLFLSEEYSRQFRCEASILASLRHPNLTRVSNYFSIPAQGQYLIMDYIKGEDLRQRIEHLDTLPSQETILIGAIVCDALTYLHTRNPPVVHRDIKPGNIKITPEGEINLVDFGLAKIMQGSQHTITGARAMTPGYSPPEQYGTARTDPRSDIYSLGATLYAVLTGVLPEDGLARATGKSKLTPLRKIKPDMNRRLAATIEKALAVDPEDRFQTAEEFQIALSNAGDFVRITQPRLTVSPPSSKHSDPLVEGKKQALENASASMDLAKRFKIPPLQTSQVKKLSVWLPIILLLMLISTLVFKPGLPMEIFSHFGTTPTRINSPPTHFEGSTQRPTQIQTIAVQALITPEFTVTPIISPSPSIAPTSEQAHHLDNMYEISFVSDRTGIVQIWIMDRDGNNKQQLINMPEGSCQPNWSPDGNQLAFISPCNKLRNSPYYDDAKIYIAKSNGADPHILPASIGGDFDPAWSPNGKRIAFTSLRNGTAHIFIFNMDDSTLEEISNTRYPDMQPTWNPSGKQLAFVRLKYFNHIWIMSDKGLTDFQFNSSGNVNDTWPLWSPDGEFIIFNRTKITPAIPWLLKLRYEDRGNEATRIPPLGSPDISPMAKASISPDGLWLVYESWPDGRNHDIYTMDITGTGRARLTTDPGLDFFPAWRPSPELL